MKNFKFLALMLAMVASVCFFASCSDDDDDDNKSSSQIVGTWCCQNHYYGGADYYTFKSNGTYSWEYDGGRFNPQTGNYAFNGAMLTLSSSTGSSTIYLIQFSNKNTFILTDEDGDSYTYRKQ